MKEIHDKELLEEYLAKYNIRSFFDTPELPFRLYEYQPGEMMNVLRPGEEYLKFVVEGVFDLYTVLEDGTAYLLNRCKTFGFLGDLAFCGKQPLDRYQEVIETVRTVELPLEPLKQTLDRDVRFLHYLVDTLSDRLVFSSRARSSFSNAQISVLAHMRWRCPDNTITNVEEAAFRLNYSARQLHRALNQLIEQGKVEKIGKGRYHLVKWDR